MKQSRPSKHATIEPCTCNTPISNRQTMRGSHKWQLGTNALATKQFTDTKQKELISNQDMMWNPTILLTFITNSTTKYLTEKLAPG